LLDAKCVRNTLRRLRSSGDCGGQGAHEHRRELRALKVFGAWTNLVDMKAGNTLDTVVTAEGRSVVRHYLQDVGSTFGTGAPSRLVPMTRIP